MAGNVRDPEEIEATLVICCSRPESVAEAVEGYTSLGDFAVVPGERLVIQDLSFDTPEGLLMAHGHALRVRRSAADMRLALKGPARAEECGGVARSEIEAEWHSQGYAEVFAALRAAGIDLPPATFTEGDPVAVFAESRLHVIQRRDLLRTTRHIEEPCHSRMVAELSIDRVSFRFPSGIVVHWEIEVEAKDTGGRAAIAAALATLQRRHGDDVRPWDWGKLTTALALRELMESAEPGGAHAGERNLSSVDYDALERHLRARFAFVGQ